MNSLKRGLLIYGFIRNYEPPYLFCIQRTCQFFKLFFMKLLNRLKVEKYIQIKEL